jgi:hypothetical protein
MGSVSSRTWPYTPARGWTADDLDDIGAEAGVCHDRLKTPVPFPVDIDLTRIR